MGSSNSEKRKRRQIKTETHQEKEQERESERERLDTDHALKQWLTRPCKPPALQTVGGLRQHRGQEPEVWIKHTLR